MNEGNDLELGLQLVETELDYTTSVANNRYGQVYLASMKIATRMTDEAKMVLRELAQNSEAMRELFPEVNTQALFVVERTNFETQLAEFGVGGIELAESLDLFDTMFSGRGETDGKA